MASRAVTPPSSPRRWSGSRARTCLRCGLRQAPTRSPLLSRRPTTSWLRPPPTVTCPLHLLLRRRELRRILIPRTPVNKHYSGGKFPLLGPRVLSQFSRVLSSRCIVSTVSKPPPQSIVSRLLASLS